MNKRKRETDAERATRNIAEAEYKELLAVAKKRDPKVLMQHRLGLPGFKRKRKPGPPR